jgi:hypothetical protein
LFDHILQANNHPAHLTDEVLIMLVEMLDGLKFVRGRLSWRAGVHNYFQLLIFVPNDGGLRPFFIAMPQ